MCRRAWHGQSVSEDEMEAHGKRLQATAVGQRLTPGPELHQHFSSLGECLRFSPGAGSAVTVYYCLVKHDADVSDVGTLR